MRIVRLGPFFTFALLLSVTALQAQQSSSPTIPVRDPQATGILTQCLANSGGSAAVAAIQDFTAVGGITYFWAGEQVPGSVTVRGLGSTDFRIDAGLQDGTRSWTVTGLNGSVKEASGKSTSIQTYNAMNLGAQTFPAVRMAVALNDPTLSVSPVTSVTLNGQKVYDVRTQNIYSSTIDPTGDLSKWSTTDYLIDPSTFVLYEIENTLCPNDGSRGEYQHETIFSNYKQVNGVLVPYSITEKVAGQQTWSIQLNSAEFNTGLTDAEFHF